MSKALLVVIALSEGATGLALLTAPSVVVVFLIGAGLEEPGAVVVARVAGAALLSLAIACWLVRAAGASLAGRAVIAALLLYNVGVMAILIHAVFGSGLSGAGTGPAILLHTAVAIWCMACLRPASDNL
ncbi:MAG TPA: hypothetical protein VMW27_09085 [Thermoanaerobaculia bacterium]|nr:hypothetical protein [Thermoanaerobaculia bacterium]